MGSGLAVEAWHGRVGMGGGVSFGLARQLGFVPEWYGEMSLGKVRLAKVRIGS